ncbi:hypothetical protein PUN28_020073 [Cardiocondyla obscurior]|uniref:Uncharacterized protein n=1 Tax=Cardiocondyla obscurior TaxID=286306 RepID=A0AAW2EA46_9HYME
MQHASIFSTAQLNWMNIVRSFIFIDYNCILKCNRFIWLVLITNIYLCLTLFYSLKCCMIRFSFNVN